jgi:hypothetical protein
MGGICLNSGADFSPRMRHILGPRGLKSASLTVDSGFSLSLYEFGTDRLKSVPLPDLRPPSSRENKPALKRRRPVSGVAFRVERSGEAR